MKAKRVSESITEMSQLMMPEHSNPAGTVYGGVIVSIADSAAYACAARHAGGSCVTVSIDQVDFHEPIRIGELVTFKAKLHCVGRTSMGVGIEIFAEDFKTGKKRHTNTCYFTMVYLNAKGHPAPVPRLVMETEEEKLLYKQAEQRRSLREKFRKK